MFHFSSLNRASWLGNRVQRAFISQNSNLTVNYVNLARAFRKRIESLVSLEYWLIRLIFIFFTSFFRETLSKTNFTAKLDPAGIHAKKTKNFEV